MTTANAQAAVYTNQHCLTTGIAGSGECTIRFVNVVSGGGGEYVFDVDFLGVHIGGDTAQLFACTLKGASGMWGTMSSSRYLMLGEIAWQSFFRDSGISLA